MQRLNMAQLLLVNLLLPAAWLTSDQHCMLLAWHRPWCQLC